MVRTDSIKKRIFALICAICMLVAGYGDLFRYTLLADTRTFTVSASDGNTYRITVNFDAASGIPEDAVLSVREIQKDEGGYTEASGESGPLYDRYVGRSAEVLGKESNSFDVARVFDISLISPSDGTEYQPKKDVAVNIELLDSDLSWHVDVNVVHFSGVPEEDAEVMETEMQGDTVAFSSDGFSVYVVTGTEPVPRRTYEFYIWNVTDGVYDPYVFTLDTGASTSRQTVRDGQIPLIPQPEYGGDGDKPFVGWFERIDTAGETVVLAGEPYDFTTPVTEDEVVELYAVFEDFFYITFHDQYNEENDVFPTVHTRRGVPGVDGKAKISIEKVTATYSGGSDMAFYGWSYTPVTVPGASRDDLGNTVSRIEPDAEGCIEISGNIELYPLFRPIKWLTFWSGPAGSGATYYPAQYCFDGLGPDTLTDHVPVRKGYTFLGWYAGTIDHDTEEVSYGANPIATATGTLINGASDGGMSVYGGALHLAANATLYAKWEGEDAADYKIIVWRQKASASADTPDSYKYDFAGSVLKSASIGAAVSVDEEYRSYADPDSPYYLPEYDGYTCRWDADADPVNPNGYTVLNVYYDRIGDYTGTPGAHQLLFVNSAGGTPISEYDNVPYRTSLLEGNEGASFVPGTPVRAHYTFTGWFADSICSTQVFFSRAQLDAYTGYNKTVLYDEMPNQNLTIYAGWEADWYIVQIDPNYGSFNGTGSTWFWKTIESDLIQEYTQVTREYVESSSGNYYYVKHDRAYYGYSGNEWDNSEPDRDVYYTTDPGEATEYKTFEPASGVYSYAGWYEVHADGSETPYDFSEHVSHDTFLRLHWKKTGVFYVDYSVGADVAWSDATPYADNAEIIITRSAEAPEGYIFVGWKVRGNENSPTYGVGKTFYLQSDYAEAIGGRDTVTLEAVFARVGTARIVYDANGGSIGDDFDYGHPKDTLMAVHTEKADDGSSATVSRIVNNSEFYLGNGTGITRTDAVLIGWSDIRIYDPEAENASKHFFALGGEFGVDMEEPVTLYAVWEAKVTWHLNVPDGEDPADFNWGGVWTGYTQETMGTSEQVFRKTVVLGNSVAEPADLPRNDGTAPFMFFCWVTAPDSTEAYDFSQPVNGVLDLYAFWRGPIEVPVHAVDASSYTLSEKTESHGWTINSLQVGTDPVALPGAGYVSAPSGTEYELAFAAVHDRNATLQTISESESVTAVYYNQRAKHLYVKYADTSRADAALDEHHDIYFVFYEKRTLDIVYRKMPSSGELLTVPAAGAPVSTVSLLGEYDMAAHVTDPKDWADDVTLHFYAYAIGDAAATNASGLNLITTASDSDASRPDLRVRNTWRGFQYTTETGTDASWVDCGYDPTLFVVYFELLPTVLMFREETEGISSVMTHPFTFNLKVTQTTDHLVKQRFDGSDWVDEAGDFTVTEDIFDTSEAPNVPYQLISGEANSAILFYSVHGAGEQIGDEFDEGTERFRYVTTAGSVTTQTAVVTQTKDPDYATSINGILQDAEPYSFEDTCGAGGGTRTVTFTNTHKAAEVEVHIALIQDGGVVLRDDLLGTSSSFMLPIEESRNFLAALPADTVYSDPSGVYAFGAVVIGSDNGTSVTVAGMGADTVSYNRVRDNLYALQVVDDGGSSMGDMAGSRIYYLYYPMPRLQYVFREGSSLSLIRGSTDGINPSTTITYGGSELTMNGVTVRQDQRIALPLSGLVISQASGISYFKMPPILDDETFQRYLSYTGIGVGPVLSSGQTADVSQLDALSADLVLYLRIQDNALSWSFTGNTWYDLSETESIFAVYTESGYDLQISKTVDMSESGNDPIFTDRSFTVTVEPAGTDSFNKSVYQVEGYTVNTVSVLGGKLTFTVRDGSKFKIRGLRRGYYIITETNNENYDLSARSGSIAGSAVTTETVTDNSSVRIPLDREKQLVLRNKPKAVCEVVCGDQTDGPLFYTLTDAIDYISANIEGGEASIALLTDYLMPGADELEIPASAHITLTTATSGTNRYSGTGRAVISRSGDLSDKPMILNHGELTLINVTLDGKSLASSEPMIQSRGTLTVDRGTTLKNAVNSGNGGAIRAIGNVGIVSGSDVFLRDNQAACGGLLYYSGTGTVTVSGGSITGNRASADGGALYAASGTILFTGGTLSGNSAAESGGAVYAENAVLECAASFTANTAGKNGGAVYSAAGAVTVSGGSMSGNTAQGGTDAENNLVNGHGGAIYAGSGSVTISGGNLTGNNAVNGNGGAVYAGSGSVEMSGGNLNTNRAAKGNGGAVYAGSGTVTVSGSSISGNSAKNGGAIYAGSGSVGISDGSIIGSTAAENGGGIYAGSGTVSVSGGSLAGNSASAGFGGAVFVDTGSAAVSGGVIGVSSGSGSANSAKNGAAVYINNGTGSFSAGTISGNTATSGGAVGVGAKTVRLEFSGTTKITGNTMGGAACNVYLDQDTEGVINTGGFGSGANVGIYVPDTITVPGENPGETQTVDIFKNRGDVGAEFGICSGTGTTVPQFHNDREANLTAAVDSITKKIYWSSPLRLEIRYLASFENNLPNGTNGDSKLSSTTIYPSSGNVSLSVLADEKRSSCSNLSATAVYATAIYELNPSYDSYLTKLLWKDGKWKLEKRDGNVVDLNTSKKIVIYFSEPAYLSIENNTDFNFSITNLAANLASQNRSLLNNNSTTGFGLVYAKDGVIQEQLLPVQADESGTYTLSQNGGSVIILVPGGRSRNFSLNGSFVNGTGPVQVRQTGKTESSVYANEAVVRTGTTPSDSGIHEIIFGPDKAICKIVCAEPTGIDPQDFVARSSEAVDDKYEYTFSKMQNAVAFAQKYLLTDVDIEMLVDYLMPSTDTAVIRDPAGGHFASITLTTAKTGEFRYSGASSDGRATISRGVGNELPLVDVAGNVGSGNDTETHVYVNGINFDGKNLTGACEGGALATKDCCVRISNAEFVNCVSRNGGAIFISFGTPNDVSQGGTKKYSFASSYRSENATLTLNNVQISNCKATYYYGRSGGGAIWTNAKVLTAEYCDFTNCISEGKDMQGGAVFHRIEATNRNSLGPTPYFAVSQTLLNNCSFTGCKAEAGGGMESDATDIQLTNCTFTNCSSTKKDGGAINVYIYEENYNYTSIPSSIALTGCNFISCTANRNGGAVRSLAVDTTATNCTFTNTVAKNDNSGNGGGAIYVSNQDSNTTTITGCTFTGAVSNKGMGGAVYTLSKALTVTNTTMANCQANGASNGNGGAVYHNPNNRSNLASSYTSISNCRIAGCTASQSGGGLYTTALNADQTKKFLVDCTIENCTALTGPVASDGKTWLGGGGIYLQNANVVYATIENSIIRDCSAPNAYGGGLFSRAKYLTIGSSTEESAGVTISGCVSGKEGGGVYHSNKSNGEAYIYNSTINGCTAAENGGGIYWNQTSTLTVGGSTFSNNKATTGSGGGMYNGTQKAFSLTNTNVSGNSAGDLGGGIYTEKYLTLVCTVIKENQLTTNTVANAAGVYMTDVGLLVVGASGNEIDNSAVMNNTTRNGADSNLRLPINDSTLENKNCVTVKCPLGTISGEGGYIGVTNAWKVGTQFGVSAITGDPTGLKDPDGVVVKDTVFNADTSTLYGIISRTDNTRKKIVWAGPPICKITDEDGKLLYFKNNGSDPAIFDVLDTGATDGRTSAFSLLRGSVTLYYEPETAGGTGVKYKGSVFAIKMLVEEYELTNAVTTVDSEDKTIILTTAGKGDTDGYPFDNTASGNRAKIIRGENVTGTMITATTNMQFKNILLDGDKANQTVDGDGAILKVAGTKDIIVTMQSNALFENGKATNGGAVAVTNGIFLMEGGLIRYCEAVNNGGAVYADNAAAGKGFLFDSGNIQHCRAVDGAGVYLNDGTLTMTGGSISGCTASGSGGGVYIAAGKTLNMSGGRIGTDGANTAETSGGGISAGAGAELNFSKQVNISKNTLSGEACNVQLDEDSNTVIRTSGLYSRSYVGVYIKDGADLFDKHGNEGDPFGYYEGSSANLYCFVNDRNGLKGGRTDPFADNTIYWIKIFSIEISKEVLVSENVPDSVREKAMTEQEFVLTVRLWDTDDNVSNIKVADILEDIQNTPEGEDSKYGNIPFTEGPSSAIITATIRLKNGDSFKAENLPDGLGYDVTETAVTGYVHIPESLSEPVYHRSGKTGENKAITTGNPYVSVVDFQNMLPVCKITDKDGNLLYRNPVGGKIGNGEQSPAVYMDLAEAMSVVNGAGGNLYEKNSTVSYSQDLRIEMLLPDYTLTAGQTLASTTQALTLKTASGSGADGFPYNPTNETSAGSTAVIRRGLGVTGSSMIRMNSGSRLTITNVKLDGNKNVTVSAMGGLVYVPSGAALTVTTGAVLQNSRTSADGAGVYVASGGKLYLSGDPVFGTQDTDGFGYLFNNTGNFKVGTLTGEQNGGKEYTVAHQDIYLAEANEGAPASLVVIGDLTGDQGSIWVWANSEYHHKQLTPFAKIDDGISFVEAADADSSQKKYSWDHLRIFRNARADGDTDNTTDTYLFGTIREEDAPGYICWSGTEGSAHVMLVKVLQSGNSYRALSNKTFTVYTDSAKTKPAKGTVYRNDGTINDKFELSGLSSGAGGAFFIGELAYGTYYIVEDGVTGAFVITIDNGGVVKITDATTNPKTTEPVKIVNLTP